MFANFENSNYLQIKVRFVAFFNNELGESKFSYPQKLVIKTPRPRSGDTLHAAQLRIMKTNKNKLLSFNTIQSRGLKNSTFTFKTK